MLQIESLTELAGRQEAAQQVLTHNREATAGTPFRDAARLHPNRLGAVETLKHIHQAGAWVLLRNVQADETYKSLVATVFGEIAPCIERKNPGVTYRAGWIFISSPNIVTPFHMDKGHNFILQISGRKRLHVWDHDDLEVVSERARDYYHRRRNAQDLLRWDDAFRARGHVFELEPGMGAYMPSTSPHLVENGPEPSITFTVTFNTDDTRRNALLHSMHDRLRSFHIEPPVVGSHPWLDATMHAGARSVQECLRMARRILGRQQADDLVLYAPRR